MTTVSDLAEYIDDTLRCIVVPSLGASLRQLRDWTGEASASASGAPPSSSMSPGAPRKVRAAASSADPVWVYSDDAGFELFEVEGSLSKVEADAVQGDAARRVLLDVGEAQLCLLRSQRKVVDAMGVGWVPPDLSRRAARLAWMAWAAKQIRDVLAVSPAPLGVKGEMTIQQTKVDVLARCCSTYRPPAEFVLSDPEVCTSCARIGVLSTVAERYAGKKLCRWCGDELGQFGALPHPDLVKLHSRGQRIMPRHRLEVGRSSRSGRTFQEAIERRAADDRRTRRRGSEPS